MLVAIFMVTRYSKLYEREQETKGLVATAFRLYKNWDRRASSVEMMLGGGAVNSVLPAQALSDPGYIAGLVQSISKAKKMSASQVANQLAGLRLLAVPQPFEGYIENVAAHSRAKAHPNAWVASMKEAFDARKRGAQDEVTFDAAEATTGEL